MCGYVAALRAGGQKLLAGEALSGVRRPGYTTVDGRRVQAGLDDIGDVGETVRELLLEPRVNLPEQLRAHHLQQNTPNRQTVETTTGP